MSESVDRMEGTDSSVATQRPGTKAREERSAGDGIPMTSQREFVVADLMTWDSASEVLEVTAMTVALKLWWRTKRLPSSIMGMMCPRPGLETRTTCAGCL